MVCSTHFYLPTKGPVESVQASDPCPDPCPLTTVSKLIPVPDPCHYQVLHTGTNPLFQPHHTTKKTITHTKSHTKYINKMESAKVK